MTGSCAWCTPTTRGVPEPRLRELVPAHCTAGGKALLAARERWRASLLSAPLRAYTERTVTEPARGGARGLATLERGYAIETASTCASWRAAVQ